MNFITRMKNILTHLKDILFWQLCSISFICSFLLLSVLRKLLEQIVTCDGLLPSPCLQTEPVTLFQFYSYLEKHQITSLEKHIGRLAKEGNDNSRHRLLAQINFESREQPSIALPICFCSSYDHAILTRIGQRCLTLTPDQIEAKQKCERKVHLSVKK